MLRDDKLTELPAGILAPLTALTSLEMSSNTKLETLPPGAFDDLTSLTSLLLNANDLTELRPGVFDGLTKLATLACWTTTWRGYLRASSNRLPR